MIPAMARAGLLRELHDDVLMDVLRAYGPQHGPRTRDECEAADQVAYEFHLRHAPTGERRGPVSVVDDPAYCDVCRFGIVGECDERCEQRT